MSLSLSATAKLPHHAVCRMPSLRYPQDLATRSSELVFTSNQFRFIVICGAKGPRPRYPRVWKSRKRIGTISKSQKLVECIKGLSNVKEEVFGALDSFVAWELEFPLIAVKKALKTLEIEKEWKRIIQVTKWMLSKGQGKTMGSYYTLLNALTEDGRLEEAEELWAKLFSENLENLPREFYIKMISIYYSRGMHEKMFEVFADMEELGVKPTNAIVAMVGNVFEKLDMQDKYEKLHKKYPPVSWEYRYFKGKRVRVPAKQPTLEELGTNPMDQLKDEPEKHAADEQQDIIDQLQGVGEDNTDPVDKPTEVYKEYNTDPVAKSTEVDKEQGIESVGQVL